MTKNCKISEIINHYITNLSSSEASIYHEMCRAKRGLNSYNLLVEKRRKSFQNFRTLCMLDRDSDAWNGLNDLASRL